MQTDETDRQTDYLNPNQTPQVFHLRNNHFVNVQATYYIRLSASTAIGQVEAACRDRRTEGASFVVTYVLDVRCVVFVKGLGETYMTLHRRVLLVASSRVGSQAYCTEKKHETTITQLLDLVNTAHTYYTNIDVALLLLL